MYLDNSRGQSKISDEILTPTPPIAGQRGQSKKFLVALRATQHSTGCRAKPGMTMVEWATQFATGCRAKPGMTGEENNRGQSKKFEEFLL